MRISSQDHDKKHVYHIVFYKISLNNKFLSGVYHIVLDTPVDV